MHTCLQIREILAVICTEISHQTILTTESHSTLLSLAIACSSLKETALDELWRIQTSLVPLVRCFPADAWEYRSGLNGRHLVFTRPLAPSDWTSVLPYTSRIKLLYFPSRSRASDHGPTEFIPLAVWDMLGISRPRSQECLLPNLRGLQWNQWRTSFRHLGQLLTPSLGRLEIHTPFDEIDDVGHSVLLALPTICPSLSILRVSSSQSSKTENLRIAPFQQWITLPLQWLVVTGHLDDYTLAHIGDIPTLRYLQFEHDQTKKVGSLPEKKFPALQELVVTGSNIDSLSQILLSVASPFMRSVQAGSTSLSSSKSYKDLFGALSRFKALELIHISEATERTYITPTEPRTIRSDDLALLSECTKLSYISIITSAIFEIEDSLFAQVEWPELKYLRLRPLSSGDARWFHPSCGITLNGGLASLITRCPRLSSLDLFIDGRVHDFSLDARPGGGVGNRTIKTLKLGTSPISNSVKVAAFLIGIFPNLVSIEATTHNNAWKEVVQHIETFRAVRSWPELV